MWNIQTKRLAAYSFFGSSHIKVHTWERQIRACLIGTFGDVQLLDYSFTQIPNVLQFWQGLGVQWGSEIRMCPDLEWWRVGRFMNGIQKPTTDV